jgi:hypothetical protein
VTNKFRDTFVLREPSEIVQALVGLKNVKDRPVVRYVDLPVFGTPVDADHGDRSGRDLVREAAHPTAAAVRHHRR